MKTFVCKRLRHEFRRNLPTRGTVSIGGLSLGKAIMPNVGTFVVDANGEAASGLNHKRESTDATPKGLSTSE